MRKLLLLSVAVLALAACGGEKYPVPAADAYASLTSIGVPNGARPLAVMSNVAITVEQIPADSAVRWQFSKDGADLGAIVARVDPDGDAASVVSTDYIEGAASDAEENRMESNLIQGGQRQLIEEGIRAHFEKRPFNTELRKSIEVAALQANIGGVMKDVSASMDAEIARRDDREREYSSEAARNPYKATAPSTDLSRFDKPAN